VVHLPSIDPISSDIECAAWIMGYSVAFGLAVLGQASANPPKKAQLRSLSSGSRTTGDCFRLRPSVMRLGGYDKRRDGKLKRKGRRRDGRGAGLPFTARRNAAFSMQRTTRKVEQPGLCVFLESHE